MVLDHIDLVAEALKLAWNLYNTYQNVPQQRGKCRELIEKVCRLARLLQELHNSRATNPKTPSLSPQAKACFEGLNQCLENAYRILEKTSRASTLRYVFLSKDINEELSIVSGNIDGFLSSIPLIQFTQAREVHAEVIDLRDEFSKLTNELKDRSTHAQEQHDLTAQVLSILQSRNGSDNEQGTLDRLLNWLAEKFQSDTVTVRREWQDMKRTKTDLIAEVGATCSSKQRTEELLLEQIIFCLDDLETGKVPGSDVSDIPEEFICPICHHLMKRPVVLTSGHSYCRSCIETYCNDPTRGRTIVCPCARIPVQADLLISNYALRSAIARWKKQVALASSSAEEVGNNTGVEERTFDEEFVRQAVLELESSNTMKQLKALKRLLEVASSTSGATLISQAGGTDRLAKLLEPAPSSMKAITEKSLAILALISRGRATADDTGQVANDIFESCWDVLLLLVTTGTGALRLKSAEVVTNLLLIPEAVDFLLAQQGIISAFVALATESDDGMDVCLQCLRKLSGNTDVNLKGDSSLVACLVDLLKSDEHSVVGETIMALKAVVASGASSACNVLKMKKTMRHLVRCTASLSGDFQEAAINILDQFAKTEGFSDLAEAGFDRLLVPLVLTAHSSENLRVLASIFRLSAACLDIRGSFELGDCEKLVSRLMDLLQTKDCTADVLQLLKVLCTIETTCKELILDNNGIAVLLTLAVSPRSTCRKGALALLTSLLRSSSCQEEFARAGGIDVLANTLHTDDNVDCMMEAVLSFSYLAANNKVKHRAVSSLDINKLVLCIDDTFPEQCRVAAASLTLWTMSETSNITMSKANLKQLGDVLQQTDSSMSIRTNVAEVMLLHASRGEAQLGGPNRTHVRELASAAAETSETYRDLLLAFVSRCRPAMEVEIPLLLEAFTRNEYRQPAAASLRILVESSVLSHSILLDSGFGRIGIAPLVSDACEDSCIEDITASLVVLFSSLCNSDEAQTSAARYIEPLVKLLTAEDARSSARRAAVCLLASLADADRPGVKDLLNNSHAIDSLLLELGQTRLEALELLSIALDDPSRKKYVYMQGGIPKLIKCLSSDNDRVQELAIFILLGLGTREAVEDIRSSMISNGIMDHLLTIVQKTNERSHAAVINSACLIRNLVRGLNNNTDQVLRTLLTVYKQCLVYINSRKEGYVERMTYILPAVETIVVAQPLKSMLKECTSSILQLLEEDFASRGDPDDKIKGSALAILVSLLQEGNKELRGTLLGRQYILALINIMEKSTKNTCKSGALDLLTVVASSSSASLKEACKIMREERCISVVLRLAQLPECSRSAHNLVNLLRQDKSIKGYVENYIPWQRTTSAPR